MSILHQPGRCPRSLQVFAVHRVLSLTMDIQDTQYPFCLSTAIPATLVPAFSLRGAHGQQVIPERWQPRPLAFLCHVKILEVDQLSLVGVMGEEFCRMTAK